MKIRKDNHELDVSPRTYESMYKRLGYKKVIETINKIFEPSKVETSKKGNTKK